MLHLQFNDAKTALQDVKQVVEIVKNSVQSARGFVLEGMGLDQVGLTMIQLMGEENTNHHRMGQLYNYTVEQKLAEQAGYEDARDYFAKTLANLSQSALTMYGAVAKNFSEQVGVRFGVTRLHLLLIYKEVADLQLNHEEPAATIIEVPGKNGEVTPKPFSACSVDEMRRAIQRKRKPSSSKPVPPTDVAQAAQYQKAVDSHMPKGASVKVLVRNEKGKSVLDIKSIPMGNMEKLIEALMSQLAYGPEERKEEKAQPSA